MLADCHFLSQAALVRGQWGLGVINTEDLESRGQQGYSKLRPLGHMHPLQGKYLASCRRERNQVDRGIQMGLKP